MDYSSSQWSHTITGLLKKTETNLTRNYSQASLPTPKSQVRFHDSLYLPNKSEDDYSSTSFDFQQFKKFVVDSLKHNSNELQKINKRLNNKDQLDSEFFEYKEDFSIAIDSIEKRCLSEIRRLESNQHHFITFDKLKITEEKLKSDNIEKFLQLELNFKDIKSTILDLYRVVKEENEEQLLTIRKNFLGIDDVRKVREGILNDVRENRGFEKKFQELEGMIGQVSKNLELKLEVELNGFIKKMDLKVQVLNENLQVLYQKLNESTEDLYQRIENSKKINEESLMQVQKVVKEQTKLFCLQEEFNIFKEKLSKLPDFQEFTKKSDLLELSQSINESNHHISLSTKQELQKLKDSKPNLNEFVKRSELEENYLAITKKLEMIKIASAGKAELEKLKKTTQDLASKEDLNKAIILLQQNQNPADLIISQLKNLETRLNELEKANRVFESKKNELRDEIRIGVIREDQIKMPEIKQDKKGPDRNKKEEEIKVMKDVKDVIGNKEDKGGIAGGIKGLKDLKDLKDIKGAKDFGAAADKTTEFIEAIFEEFVNCEIDFGVKTMRKRQANRAPAIKINDYPESSSQSEDDLNQAVILNTDLTNKSESPIDFSKF